MSYPATARAWESTASGNDLLVLLALADHAGGEDDPYGHAYPAVARLEGMTRLSRRTVQRCLRSLEEAGHIRSTGEYAWGRGKSTVIYRIETGRQSDAASPEDRGGVNDDVEGASPVTPKPSIEPSSKQKGERAREQAQNLPDDFPAELVPHARGVFRTLKAIAEQHNAREVTPRAVGLAIQGAPGRRYVSEAFALASWAQSSRPIKDAVGTYRTWLGKAEPCAGIEQVDAKGYPTAPTAAAVGTGNVAAFRRRGGPSAADFLAAGGA